MAKSGDTVDIYTLLTSPQVTGEAIEDLLRRYRDVDPKLIRITAPTKKELVEHNLRQAVDAQLIPITELFELLRDSEEHGAQHIRFYKPKTSTVKKRLGKGKTIAKAIFDQRALPDFPKLRASPPQSPMWSDFRITDDGWVGKMYTRIERKEFLGPPTVVDRRPDGRPIYQRLFIEEVERAVLLARWRSKLNLFELRVPKWTSRKAVDELFKILEDAIKPALNRKRDLVPWNLTRSCTNLVKEESKYEKIYDLGETLLRDSSRGTHTISPQDEEQSLFACVERRQAIAAILNNGLNSSERLVVVFLPQNATDAINSKLRVTVGGALSNEIVIGSKSTLRAVDHVIYRLRQFDRPASA
ncbi:MAG: hypothetical protein AAF916_06930 [Planctomycetota bacterium]